MLKNIIAMQKSAESVTTIPLDLELLIHLVKENDIIGFEIKSNR